MKMAPKPESIRRYRPLPTLGGDATRLNAQLMAELVVLILDALDVDLVPTPFTHFLRIRNFGLACKRGRISDREQARR